MHVITEKDIISQSMKLPLLVSVLLIVSFADEGFIKPVNGQEVITEDFIKIKDCSKYIHKYLTVCIYCNQLLTIV